MTTPSFFVTVEQAAVDVEITESITDVVLIGGPPGPTGATGATGATGPIGPTGAAGATGPAPARATDVITSGDGATTAFVLSQPPLSLGSVQVFRNGLAEVNGLGFSVAAVSGGAAVTFAAAPLATDVIAVIYDVEEAP